jgi:hypothetical protein
MFKSAACCLYSQLAMHASCTAWCTLIVVMARPVCLASNGLFVYVLAGLFALAQQPPWANGSNSAGTGQAAGSNAAFAPGGNFVFGAAHPAAPRHHTAEAEMEG